MVSQPGAPSALLAQVQARSSARLRMDSMLLRLGRPESLQEPSQLTTCQHRSRRQAPAAWRSLPIPRTTCAGPPLPLPAAPDCHNPFVAEKQWLMLLESLHKALDSPSPQRSLAQDPGLRSSPRRRGRWRHGPKPGPRPPRWTQEAL